MEEWYREIFEPNVLWSERARGGTAGRGCAGIIITIPNFAKPWGKPQALSKSSIFTRAREADSSGKCCLSCKEVVMLAAQTSNVQFAQAQSEATVESKSHWQICTTAPVIGEGSPIHSTQIDSSQDAEYRRFDMPEMQAAPHQSVWSTSTEVAVYEESHAGSNVYLVEPAHHQDSDYHESSGLHHQRLAQGYRRQSHTAPNFKERYRRLISEAAHDLRSPIATASQLITTVSERARGLGNVTPAELDMLEIANQRLAQASNWAAGILVDRRLEQLSAIAIKKRFYPKQWQTLMLPLLDAVAKDHSVRLLWLGWERSLPRVYLDVNHASRVLLNLVTNAIQASSMGSQITIRVELSRAPASRLLVHVEDQGSGLDSSLMSIINSPTYADEPPHESNRNAGIGLNTCRQLVEGFGGAISAEHLEPRGTRFTLAIPVDDLRLSLRSWLMRQANERIEGPAMQCSAFGLRIGSALEPAQADQRLHLNASSNEYLHRAGVDRWLCFTTAPQATYRKLKSLSEELQDLYDSPQLRFLHIASSEPLVIEQDSFAKMQEVPGIAEELYEVAGRGLEDEIPLLDDLQSDFGHLYSQSLLRTHGRLRRADSAQSTLRRPSESYQRTPGDYQWTPAESKRMTNELSDLAHGWKRTQDKLQKAHQ